MTTKRAEPVLWEGPDKLRPFLAPIDSLRLDPRNPRQGDVVAIAASLERFGQRRLAVVNSHDEQLVEAGNHMILAARDVLRWRHRRPVA